ncbi:hypothetical protein AB1K70_24140 [Bremerella sp. JC770]|uniref:hypothetical protein n=1 Tax=Bremerella sp. JC770 TaxID=3232137 RepID=UPI003457B37C
MKTNNASATPRTEFAKRNNEAVLDNLPDDLETPKYWQNAIMRNHTVIKSPRPKYARPASIWAMSSDQSAAETTRMPIATGGMVMTRVKAVAIPRRTDGVGETGFVIDTDALHSRTN